MYIMLTFERSRYDSNRQIVIISTGTARRIRSRPSAGPRRRSG